jgi:hypothetical protein
LVEEPDPRDSPHHRERSAGELVGGADDPRPRQLAVESDTDVRADTRFELGWKGVREQPVEREDRPVDADRDRA